MKSSPHQQLLQMSMALHPLANQFCEENLLQNVPQNPQNFLQIKTKAAFHLGWKVTLIMFQLQSAMK